MKPARDRGWAGLAGLVALGAALAAGTAAQFREHERQEISDRASIFGADANGARALFLMLRSEGLPAQPLTRPLTPGMEAGLLVVLDPGTFNPDDARTIREWVAKGNAIIVASDGPSQLVDPFQLTIRGGSSDTLGIAEAANPAWGLRLATHSDSSVRGGGRSLFARDDASQVQEIPCGDGEAVVIADVFCSTNAGIDAADNVFFWLETVKRLSAGRPVWFLETHHGHMREPAVTEYLGQVGLGPTVLQIILLVACAAWIFGTRPAPVLAPSTLIRRPAAEYAATMAHLYRKGQADRHAVSVARAEFESWLNRPQWTRGLARLTAAERAAAETEALEIGKSGKELAGRSRPGEAAAWTWIARAARFRERFRGSDAE